MSELTKCNFCSLRQLKSQAKQDKQKVTILPAKRKQYNLGGLDVFIHPKTINIKRDFPHSSCQGSENKYWVGWFKELSNNCVC